MAEWGSADELKELGEELISSEDKYNGHVVRLKVDSVKLPNGRTTHREVVRHIGAVCMIPVFENGDVLIERQYRYPMNQVLTEIPAGKLDSTQEDRLEAAKRELLEETGYVAHKWVDLGIYYPTVAYTDEKISIFLCTELENMGTRNLDEGEFLNVHKVPLKELVRMVMDGEITDGKTQVAVLKAEKYLSDK